MFLELVVLFTREVSFLLIKGILKCFTDDLQVQEVFGHIARHKN